METLSARKTLIIRTDQQMVPSKLVDTSPFEKGKTVLTEQSLHESEDEFTFSSVLDQGLSVKFTLRDELLNINCRSSSIGSLLCTRSYLRSTEALLLLPGHKDFLSASTAFSSPNFELVLAAITGLQTQSIISSTSTIILVRLHGTIAGVELPRKLQECREIPTLESPAQASPHYLRPFLPRKPFKSGRLLISLRRAASALVNRFLRRKSRITSTEFVFVSAIVKQSEPKLKAERNKNRVEMRKPKNNMC
ncbi:hypothetical protein CR513_44029, partial [Mucuna pruriens]